jgi:hypothetical protein
MDNVPFPDWALLKEPWNWLVVASVLALVLFAFSIVFRRPADNS